MPWPPPAHRGRTATDLADWLVRTLAIPFREAHHITGSLVALADQENCQVSDLTLAQLQSVEPRISSGVFDVLTPQASIASRTSHGGTAPLRVAEALKTTAKDLAQLKTRFGMPA